MKDVDQGAHRKAAVYERVASAEADSAERLAEQASKVIGGLPPGIDGDLVEVYAEIGSGLLGFDECRGGRVRPELQRLANDIRQGKVRSVHTADGSRLARSVGVWFRFVELCEEHGVRVFAGNEEVAGLGEMGKTPHLAAMAQCATDLFDGFYLRALRSRTV